MNLPSLKPITSLRIFVSFIVSTSCFIPINLAYSQGKRLDEKTPKTSNELIAINNHEEYILGAGDGIYIDFAFITEFSGKYFIGPDGSLYLPELNKFYASGYTVSELIEALTKAYKKYIKSPDINIQMVKYRPIRVYVLGEVNRPGLYALNGVFEPISTNISTQISNKSDSNIIKVGKPEPLSTYSSFLFPTVFDALKASQGVSIYSNLSEVEVHRINTISNGGGKIKTKLSFISLFTKGDQTQNIRIFDGDTILVPKSSKVLTHQLIKAQESNITPDEIVAYVSGQVQKTGPVKLPQGAALTQAIALAGGKKNLSGRIEFLRFDKYGEIDRRVFNYSPSAKSNTYKNPILKSGDVINIQNSIVGYTADVLGKVTAPIAGYYTLTKLFE